jgi:hypothetical protein
MHDTTSVATSKKHLQFLVHTLTKLISFEPAYYLKVYSSPYYFCNQIQMYIKMLPRFTKIRSAVNEFIMLAKARLSELGDNVSAVDDTPTTAPTNHSDLAAMVQSMANKFQK